MEDNDTLVAAVDGKSARHSFDENGDPLLMLNVFVHDLKVTLNQWSVRGDKTNEPGCLKAHLEKLFEQYPALRLLTGDAIFAQRPLLEVLKERGCDYLFQLKKNQGDAYEAVKYCFKDAETTEPDHIRYGKKGAMLTSANCVATLILPGSEKGTGSRGEFLFHFLCFLPPFVGFGVSCPWSLAGEEQSSPDEGPLVGRGQTLLERAKAIHENDVQKATGSVTKPDGDLRKDAAEQGRVRTNPGFRLRNR